MTFDIVKYGQFLIGPSSQVVRGFVSIYIVNQHLGLTAVGVWAQVLACHAFMYLFINFNLTQSMSRYYPRFLNESINVFRVSNTVFLVNLGFIVLYFIILFPFKNSVLNFVYGSDALKGFYLLAFLFIVENLYNVIYCHYRSVLKSEKQALLALSRLSFEMLFFFPFVHIFDAWYTLDIYTFLFLYIAFVFSSVVIAVVYLRETRNIFTAGFLIVSDWWQFVGYGLRLLPMSLSFWLISQPDRWFVAGKFDHETLGFYFIATRFFMAYAFLVSPFHAIYTYIASETDQGLEGFYKVIRVAVFIALTFSFILYLGHPFLLLLFKLEPAAYLSVANLVPYMLISGFLYAFYAVLNTFRSINNPGQVSIEWLILGVIYLSALSIFPSYFGLKGLVFAQIFSYSVVLIFVLIRLRTNERH